MCFYTGCHLLKIIPVIVVFQNDKKILFATNKVLTPICRTVDNQQSWVFHIFGYLVLGTGAYEYLFFGISIFIQIPNAELTKGYFRGLKYIHKSTGKSLLYIL